MVLRKAALLVRDALAAFAASFGRELMVFRKAALFVGNALAAFAGDFALAHGARGGVYIAGGIAKKIEHTLGASRFRARFEDKGRLRTYVADIPSFIIRHPFPAFVGLAALLRNASTVAARLD